MPSFSYGKRQPPAQSTTPTVQSVQRPAPAQNQRFGAYTGGMNTGMPAQSPFRQSNQMLGQRKRQGTGAAGAADAQAPRTGPQGPTPGTHSGPGILENWFNQRATGTDPAFEYGMGRATDDINREMAARGGYNSSFAGQRLSDMYANSVAQRQGQLDQLAAGASGEHQRRLESMFQQGMGIAGGQAGVAGAYDQAAGGAMAEGQRAQLDLMLAKAGVDQKTRQAQLDAIFGVAKTAAGFIPGVGGGGGGGGYPTGDEIYRPY